MWLLTSAGVQLLSHCLDVEVSVVMMLQATSMLVSAIRGQAEDQGDSEMQKRLLAAAKQLADATAKLVEAAKVRVSACRMNTAWGVIRSCLC